MINENIRIIDLTVSDLRQLIRSEIGYIEKPTTENKKYVYGLKPIQKLFNCGVNKAIEIKEILIKKGAAFQDGRKICVDLEKAMEVMLKQNKL